MTRFRPAPPLILTLAFGPACVTTPAPFDDDATVPPGDDDSTAAPSPCPTGMARIADAVPFCIDQVEASTEVRDGDGVWGPFSPYLTAQGRELRAVSIAGAVPQGYVSADEAEAACLAAGKMLCTSDQWLLACRGAEDRLFPYGDAHVEGACNDSYPDGHPVVHFWGSADGVWDSVHMNDPGINQQPDSVDAAGLNPLCVTPDEVFDLHGNLHEWVADGDGTFRGGFYADASINGPGCTYVTTAHDRSYHDYSTGFRCCAAILE